MSEANNAAHLQSYELREQALLARYAMRSSDSRGRKRPESSQPYRGPFQRDRDRVLHSAAFRRLSGKTQVFTGDLGDYHRTRLTHTHEVASIARTIGRALRLNEDLVEALALFHDIGHPPYGHAGEDALNEALADHGGFSHNQFAITLAEHLEDRRPDAPGLNLTFEVLESQATRIDKRADDHPLLEAQVVEAADSITYNAHDADDAVKLGLVTLDELAAAPLAGVVVRQVRERYVSLNAEQFRRLVVHDLIEIQVASVLRSAGPRLAEARWRSAEEARRDPQRIAVDGEIADAKRELEQFLYQRVYRHPDIMRQRRAAQAQLRELFDFYRKWPDRLPPRFQAWAERVGPPRAAGDYLAGMTDRFCERQARLLLG